METGVDKKQIEAIKRFFVRLGRDPGRLKTAVCVVMAGIGLFAVERPLGLRLEAARVANAKAKSASAMAEEAVRFTRQRALYEERVAVASEITDWQNYVLDLLRDTSAMLVSLEPRKAVAKGPFQVVEMEVVAKGSSYNEFAEFVERLERGPRIVRIEKLRMERQQGTIYVTLIVKGLVKPSAKKAKAAAETDAVETDAAETESAETAVAGSESIGDEAAVDDASVSEAEPDDEQPDGEQPDDEEPNGTPDAARDDAGEDDASFAAAAEGADG